MQNFLSFLIDSSSVIQNNREVILSLPFEDRFEKAKIFLSLSVAIDLIINTSIFDHRNHVRYFFDIYPKFIDILKGLSTVNIDLKISDIDFRVSG